MPEDEGRFIRGASRDGGGRAERRGGRGRGGAGRPPRRDVMVTSITPLTPRLTRLVAGPLVAWPVSGLGAHCKIFLPGTSGGELAMRTYTVRAYDEAQAELTVDFALHAGGPATEFAHTAAPGTAFQVSGMARGGFSPSVGSASTLFIADHCALPAVCAIAEGLPAGHRAQILIEIPDDQERLSIDCAAEVTTTWLTAAAEPCQRLAEAVRELDFAAGDGDVWVGCEAQAMRAIRHHLLHERGFAASQLHTRAYWKQGVLGHSDHDTGEEDD